MEIKHTCIFIFLLTIACISCAFGKDFVQRIEWEGDNSVLRYEIQIKDSNKSITTYETKNTYIDVSLPAGKYYYSLLIYDLLNRLSLTTDWYPLEIVQALQPTIDSVELRNKKPLFGDTLTVIIAGTDFEETPAIVFTHLETNTEYTGKITKFSDTKIEVIFENSEIPEGTFNIELENPCGFFTNYTTFQFAYEQPQEILPPPEDSNTLLPQEEIAIPIEPPVKPKILSIQKNEITLQQGQKNELLCSVLGLLDKTTFFLCNNENDNKIPLSYKIVSSAGSSTIINLSFPNAITASYYQICMENPRELIDKNQVVKIIVLHNREWYLSGSLMYPIYYTESGLVLKDGNFSSIGVPVQVSLGFIPINTPFGSFGLDLSASYKIFVAESNLLIQNMKIVSAYPAIQYQKQIISQKLAFNVKAGIGMSFLDSQMYNKSDMSLHDTIHNKGYFSWIMSGSFKIYPANHMFLEFGCDFVYMNIPFEFNTFVMPKIGIGLTL